MIFGLHWHQWEDLGREPDKVLTLSWRAKPFAMAEFRGKMHQRCTVCGAERRINA